MCAALFDRKLSSGGMETHERRVMLHFGNAPFHNIEGFKKIWGILDSEEWNIRLKVPI
jgi:hypothetical protein